ncbi:alpha-L-fucosidase [uncultured Draconibacterium sp.]|uniref:alpha-L-fucosidase n=1 Tax=uncultured Draconibacterium sp. TaxID=1573823 RepID=UPI0032601DB4
MNKLLVLCIAIAFALSLNAQKTFEPNWESIDSRQTPEWFTDSKFGIFIHWGVYSVPAWAPADIAVGKNFGQKFSEWYWYRLEDPKNEYFKPHHEKMYGKQTYQEFAPQFKAEYFNPDKWAEIIKNSGARYVVLTSKHHDGFALWPSKQSWNWNSVDVGSHRDLCGELSKSVKSAGLHMGFYYSLYEWFNPLYKTDLEKYVYTHMIPQMKDLVTSYEPEVLWTDGEWEHTSDKFKSVDFLAWLYNESPVKETIVVNDRWGKETRSKHGGFYTTEYGHVHEKEGIEEEEMHPWEECRGIGGSFGWNRTENLENYSSSEALVHMLIEKVANGGNLLLNIGPTHDGRIPVIMQQRLADIGQWMKVNSEAIYGTKAWDNRPDNMKENQVFYTVKDNALYAICTAWHEKIIIPNISGTGQVSLLGSDVKVKSKIKGETLTIYAPDVNPGNVPCDYAYTFKIVDFK